MTTKIKAYKWILFDEHKFVIGKGIVEECVDMFCHKIFPEDDSDCDRCLWDMQKYADDRFPEKKYRFFYEEIEIDFDEFIKQSLE
jgi:hypothetical protein